MISPSMAFGLSNMGMVLGSSHTSAVSRAAIGWDLLRFGLKVGGTLAAAVGTYTYLTNENLPIQGTNRTESLIGRGARQFGESYFGSGPEAYYQGQVEVLPKQTAMEAELYAANAPTYTQAAVDREWAIAQAKAEAYQAMQPYYTQTETAKATTKMPYTPRIL